MPSRLFVPDDNAVDQPAEDLGGAMDHFRVGERVRQRIHLRAIERCQILRNIQGRSLDGCQLRFQRFLLLLGRPQHRVDALRGHVVSYGTQGTVDRLLLLCYRPAERCLLGVALLSCFGDPVEKLAPKTLDRFRRHQLVP
ncbi:hypothetical protein [Roseivivax lentus]|uniref:hypothetical protein n=1 Tax=Roseivivax lentus TaxID=633194 RepID=UPI0009FD186C|nr:hypothetical protein [Roseivivax lentus]